MLKKIGSLIVIFMILLNSLAFGADDDIPRPKIVGCSYVSEIILEEF